MPRWRGCQQQNINLHHTSIGCTSHAACSLSSRWKTPADSSNTQKSSKLKFDAEHQTMCTSSLRAISISVANTPLQPSHKPLFILLWPLWSVSLPLVFINTGSSATQTALECPSCMWHEKHRSYRSESRAGCVSPLIMIKDNVEQLKIQVPLYLWYGVPLKSSLMLLQRKFCFLLLSFCFCFSSFLLFPPDFLQKHQLGLCTHTRCSARIQLEMAPPHLPWHSRCTDEPHSVRVLRSDSCGWSLGSQMLVVWRKLLMNVLVRMAFSVKASPTGGESPPFKHHLPTLTLSSKLCSISPVKVKEF